MRRDTKTNAEWRKIVAAVARTQGGVVDLPQIECDVRIATLQMAIDDVWEILKYYDCYPTIVELADQLLPKLEDKLNMEIFQKQTTSLPEEDRALNARLRAEHRARRGVKKVRGAK